MAKKNLTIFQRLGQILGPDGIKQQQQQPAQGTQRYNIGKDVLLKTTDKNEYEQAKLQAQQNKYLGQVWKRLNMDYSNRLLIMKQLELAHILISKLWSSTQKLRLRWIL